MKLKLQNVVETNVTCMSTTDESTAVEWTSFVHNFKCFQMTTRGKVLDNHELTTYSLLLNFPDIPENIYMCVADVAHGKLQQGTGISPFC